MTAHTSQFKLIILQSSGFLLADKRSAVLCRAAYVISERAGDNESEGGIASCTYSWPRYRRFSSLGSANVG